MLADLVNAHVMQISHYVQEMGTDVRVSQNVEKRKVSEYSGSLNFGESDLTDDVVAFISSSNGVQYQGLKINCLLVLPSIQGSLYVSKDSMATDFFYILENGVIKPIQLDAPLPLDGVNIYRSDIKEEVPSDLQISSPFLRSITDSKIRTKEVLNNYGINVPNYAVVNPLEADKELRRFLEKNGLMGFLIKPDSDSGGAGIRFYGREHVRDATEHIKELASDGSKVVYVDDRVFSYPWIIDGTPQDWNIRAFIALNDKPQWIDAIVRYGELRKDPLTQKPINICKGCNYTTLEDAAAQTNVSIEEIIEGSLRIAQSIQDEVLASGETPRGFIGLDIMPNNQITVIEANDSNSGGFYELIKLRGKPLSCISEKLLPAMGPFLKRNHFKCRSQTYTTTLKATRSTYYCAANDLAIAGNLPAAINLFQEAIRQGYGDAEIYTNVAIYLATVSRLAEGLEAAKKAYDMDPKVKFVVNHLVVIYTANGEHKKAIEHLHELDPFEMDSITAYVSGAGSYVHLGDHTKAREYYEKVLDWDTTDMTAKYRLGITQYQKSEYEEAFRYFNLAAEVENTNQIVRMAGNNLMGSRYTNVISWYLEAIDANPDDLELRGEFDYIASLFREFCRTTGSEHYTKVLQSTPNTEDLVQSLLV